jgi:hypothetical protein
MPKVVRQCGGYPHKLGQDLAGFLVTISAPKARCVTAGTGGKEPVDTVDPSGAIDPDVQDLSVSVPKPFEPIRQFRPVGASVRQLADEQCERLDVSGDPQGGLHPPARIPRRG